MARKLPRLQRVLDAPALFSIAYGEIASSIYFALGIIAFHALGFSPAVLLVVVAIVDLVTQLLLVVLGFALLFSSHALTRGTSLGHSPSWHSIAFALPLAMLAYTGLETVANLAEETRRPGRDLPRSLFSAIGLVVVLYVLIAVVALSAFPPAHGTELGSTWLRSPLVGVVSQIRDHVPAVVGDPLQVFVGLSGALILVTAATTSISGFGRLAYSLGEHGQLPRKFGWLSARTLVSADEHRGLAEAEYSRILVPMKLGEIGEEMVATAVKLAQERGAAVDALHVIRVPLDRALDAELIEEEERAEASLAEAKLLGADHGVKVAGHTVRARSIGQAIVSEAERLNADLIVLGSSPRWRRQSRFFSPTVDYVLKKAPAEVVIVATDGDNTNIVIGQVAQKRFGIDCTVVRILDPARADFYAQRGLRTVCPTSTAIDVLTDVVRSCEVPQPTEEVKL